jgi:cyclopropane fatty-acyl-phospholipid synthase-like methyltransferase
MDLLVDLHRAHRRQGPGSDATTRLAASLAGLDRSRRLRIADVGCGTGAASLVLAEELDADIVSVDLLEPFLHELTQRAAQRGLADRITTRAASMDDLPFADGEFDVIWSEGAIYSMGFARGVADWRRFLAPGGALVVSEITWLTATRPAALERHWRSEYAEIDAASAKMAVLERDGLSPVAYFVLPEHCWRQEYYAPVLADLDAFCDRHGNSEAAQAIAAEYRREAALYDEFHPYFGYGVYVARRTM